MPPLPRLLGGLFAGLLMVHLSIPNQVVSSNELICSSVWDLQCGLAHKRGNAGGRSLSPHRNGAGEAIAICKKRADLYEQTRTRHPRRWTGAPRCWRQPEMVWINPPSNDFIAQTDKLELAA